MRTFAPVSKTFSRFVTSTLEEEAIISFNVIAKFDCGTLYRRGFDNRCLNLVQSVLGDFYFFQGFQFFDHVYIVLSQLSNTFFGFDKILSNNSVLTRVFFIFFLIFYKNTSGAGDKIKFRKSLINLRVAKRFSAFRLDKFHGFTVQLLVDIPTNDGRAKVRVLQGELLAHTMTSTCYQHNIATDITLCDCEHFDDSFDDSIPELDMNHDDIDDHQYYLKNHRTEIVGTEKQVSSRLFSGLTTITILVGFTETFLVSLKTRIFV